MRESASNRLNRQRCRYAQSDREYFDINQPARIRSPVIRRPARCPPDLSLGRRDLHRPIHKMTRFGQGALSNNALFLSGRALCTLAGGQRLKNCLECISSPRRKSEDNLGPSC